MSENLYNRCPNCARLERKIAVLQNRVAQLEQLLIEATRANKRQAAPFSKAKPKTNPQKPGRKAGQNYGTKAHRQAPDSWQELDQIIDVPLPEQCPDCGGTIEQEGLVQQFQVEIPRRPIYVRFDIHVGRCRTCGKRIQARHPRQCSDAIGAAGSQLGPDTQTMVTSLKSKHGLSYGKICAILKDHFGIPLSRGGAVQVVHRTARRSQPTYPAICRVVRESPVVYPDETGWKVGGNNQWLWTFVTKDATVYVIRPSRGHQVAQEILGANWNGTMVHDGWSPYDFFDKAKHQQCLGHLLNRGQELVAKAIGRTRHFPEKVKDFLHHALDLRNRRDEHRISARGLGIARGRLERRLDRLLDCQLSHPENRRFRNHLLRHRYEILTFLYRSDIEATNWPAEQAIRPAVVNRKVFGGNRTEAGARAQEVLASVFVTCAQRGQDALSYLAKLICSRPEHRVALVHSLLPAR